MIRRYKEKDLEDLLSTWAAGSALAHPFLSQEFLESERHLIRTQYLRQTETWVWEADRSVVGFICLKGIEICGLFVAPGYHRRGIGRALVDHARRSRRRLEVEVFKDNPVGRTFYLRYGFRPMREGIHEDTGLEVLRLELPEDTTGPSRED